MKSKMQIHMDRWDAKVSVECMKLSRSMAGDVLHLLQGPSHVLSVAIGFRFAHMRCILGELVASIYFCSTTFCQSDEQRLIHTFKSVPRIQHLAPINKELLSGLNNHLWRAKKQEEYKREVI